MTTATSARALHDSGRDDISQLVTLTPHDIVAIPWEPLPNVEQARQRVLFRHGDFVVAQIWFPPGTTDPGTPHYAARHHVWVLAGNAYFAGRVVVPGSYVHVPPGVAHPLLEVGQSGLLVLSLYRPFGPQESSL